MSATSPHVFFLSGEPFTVQAPAAKARSCSLASSRCAAIFRPLSLILSRHLTMALPPTHAERLPYVPYPERDLRGVAVDDLDLLHRDAELVGDELGERGLVPLPVRVRPRIHGHRARRVDAHLAGLPEARARAERARDGRWRRAARLDVRADADADVPPLRAKRELLLACLVVSDQLERASERRLVVAAVVRERHGRLVRSAIGELRDEVLAPELRRIDPELPRGAVH